GPVSMSFTMGGVLTPYTKAMFLDLIQRVQRPNRKYKIVLGGPGAWHFDYRQEMQESLGIDHIVHGEVDHLVPEIFDRIVNDHAPPVMRFTNATAPGIREGPLPVRDGPTRRQPFLPDPRHTERRGHEPRSHPGHLDHRPRRTRQVGRHPERNRDGEPEPLAGCVAPEGGPVHR